MKNWISFVKNMELNIIFEQLGHHNRMVLLKERIGP